MRIVEQRKRVSYALDMTKGLGKGLCGLLIAAGLAGCGVDERGEAVGVLHALVQLQAAEPAQRKGLLDALEQKPAEGRVAERARRTCLAAYRALDEANRATAALPDGGLPEALDRDSRELLGTLSRADEQLDEANRLLPECRQATSALRKFAR